MTKPESITLVLGFKDLTTSGNTIMVGYRKSGEVQMDVGAVLNKEDQVLQNFDFPRSIETERGWGNVQIASK